VAERWTIVTEDEVLSHAGNPAQTYPADNVTYVVGPLATLIILEPGDRPGGNGVQTRDGLTLHEPFPSAVEALLVKRNPVKWGFVRVPEKGYIPLGTVYYTGGEEMYRGGSSALISCELKFQDRLDLDVLQQIRQTAQDPLPDIDWLRSLERDPLAAMTGFIARWYADLPPSRDKVRRPPFALPKPLLAFYQAAAGRREIYGVQNELFEAGRLEREADGRVMVGTENQGVFDMYLNPAEADPRVQYDGLDVAESREPLSRFLLQFLLFEAASASPFGAFATVTAEQARRLVEPLHEVPLEPLEWPVDPTRFSVAPGLVVAAGADPDGAVEVWAGSRQRWGLRSLRDPGFSWHRFDG
jgi:hypothetical protein